MVAVLHGGGLVQEEGWEQAGCLAVSGGLVPTEPTNGGIARGGKCGADLRGRYGTPPVRKGSAPRSRRGGKSFPSNENCYSPS